MEIISLSVVIFLGLIFGSFATALSHRLVSGQSIFSVDRSECPACHHKLGMADLVPLLSWVLLKGKCRYCRFGIGIRYPLIECATLSLCLIFYYFYGFGVETAFMFILAPVIIAIIDIDLRYKIIPDGLNLSILLTGLMALCVNSLIQAAPLGFFLEKGVWALSGLLMYGLGSLLLRQGAMLVIKREAMGLGDIKFFAAAGFWMGPSVETAALFMIISGVAGILLALFWKRLRGESEFPFGPALIIAFIAVLALNVPAFIDM